MYEFMNEWIYPLFKSLFSCTSVVDLVTELDICEGTVLMLHSLWFFIFIIILCCFHLILSCLHAELGWSMLNLMGIFLDIQ